MCRREASARPSAELSRQRNIGSPIYGALPSPPARTTPFAPGAAQMALSFASSWHEPAACHVPPNAVQVVAPIAAWQHGAARHPLSSFDHTSQQVRQPRRLSQQPGPGLSACPSRQAHNGNPTENKRLHMTFPLAERRPAQRRPVVHVFARRRRS